MPPRIFHDSKRSLCLGTFFLPCALEVIWRGISKEVYMGPDPLLDRPVYLRIVVVKPVFVFAFGIAQNLSSGLSYLPNEGTSMLLDPVAVHFSWFTVIESAWYFSWEVCRTSKVFSDEQLSFRLGALLLKGGRIRSDILLLTSLWSVQYSAPHIERVTFTTPLVTLVYDNIVQRVPQLWAGVLSGTFAFVFYCENRVCDHKVVART